jgi:hypothetical protein
MPKKLSEEEKLKLEQQEKALDEERCPDLKSRELPAGKDEPPGDRGVCSKESATQGSE